MKRVLEFFESIADKKLRDAVIKNYNNSDWRKHLSNEYAPDMATALTKGFLWLNSPEGVYFWAEIAANADKIITK